MPMPIYTNIIVASFSKKMKDKTAILAITTAIKCFIASKVISNLKFYQKGTYFRELHCIVWRRWKQ
ncbi:MAG: hypothetical protein ACTTHM_09580 [Peptoanaerobacter stomatis]